MSEAMNTESFEEEAREILEGYATKIIAQRDSEHMLAVVTLSHLGALTAAHNHEVDREVARAVVEVLKGLRAKEDLAASETARLYYWVNAVEAELEQWRKQ
jgi:GGDEF domain-containing protein